MTATLKATIQAYDEATRTATIMLVGSLPAFLADIPVATNINPADCLVGRTCALLLFDPNNPSDSLVTAVHTPTPPSPTTTIAGDLQLAPAAGQTVAHAALAPAVPSAYTQLLLGGQFGSLAGSWKALDISPQLTVPSGSGGLQALFGQATLTVPSGASGLMQGLQFTAMANGQGTVTEMEAVWARIASQSGSTVAITKAAALYARSPLWWGAKPAACYGLYVEPHGASGITNAVGALIDAPTGGTNRYTIWAGAPITGTPRLRLDAGTPAANQTLLWLAEGTTPTLRQVQCKQFQLLQPLDRVMILV